MQVGLGSCSDLPCGTGLDPDWTGLAGAGQGRAGPRLRVYGACVGLGGGVVGWVGGGGVTVVRLV